MLKLRNFFHASPRLSLAFRAYLFAHSKYDTIYNRFCNKSTISININTMLVPSTSYGKSLKSLSILLCSGGCVAKPTTRRRFYIVLCVT